MSIYLKGAEGVGN